MQRIDDGVRQGKRKDEVVCITQGAMTTGKERQDIRNAAYIVKQEGREKAKKGILKTGSFTIEASIIMILVLSAVLLSIYYCLYLHDKAVIEAVARKTALIAGRSLTENRSVDTGEIDWQMYIDKALLWRLLGAPDRTIELKRCAEEEINGELLACQNAAFDISTYGTTVRVSYNADTKLAAFGFFNGYPNVSRISGEIIQKSFEQEEFIRLIRGIIGDANRQQP